MADQGPLPDLSGRGTQGLFDQSSRPVDVPGNVALPGSSSTTEPALPGSSTGHAERPQNTRRSKPRRKPKRLRRLLLLLHVTVAVVALASLARSNHAVNVRIPKFDSQNFADLARKRASGTPASKTMVIVPSGGPVANGVYLARRGAIDGASSTTSFEFALTGRGSRQRVVYVAGLRVRDRSCDGRPANSKLSGLVLYNDELSARGSAVSGRTITATFRGGPERLSAEAESRRTITGTFRFGRYTACPTGGHFRFTATRLRTNKPVLAPLIQRMAG